MKNIHVISRYEIEAPDVVHVYREEGFIIKARFFDQDGNLITDNRLFVQCFLCGPNGEYIWFPLLDDGVLDDEKANDGVYTGIYSFGNVPCGIYKYFVIAQDINTATTDLNPADAAKIIGGMVLTGQLTIDFSGGTCSLVPDGHVNVICQAKNTRHFISNTDIGKPDFIAPDDVHLDYGISTSTKA